MQAFSEVVDFLNHYVWSFPEALPWLVVALLGTGLFLTVRLGLIQFRKTGHALAIVSGKYDDPEDSGDISHFQALSTALSATVGVGNIAGVATAIHYGGPGAVFWMWVTALFGMAVKYSECTLALKYRTFDHDGAVAGGPMYYIERGLGSSFKPLAVLFAVCGALAALGTGNMNQANTVAVSAGTDFGLSPLLVGFVCSAVVGGVILGGIRRIAAVSSRLAPSMAAVYVAGALIILALHAPQVPGAFLTILEHAFNPRASVGGSVLGAFSVTMLWGVKRGLFSNEAGQGSAPIAHAAARTDEPVREGAVAMLEPLIDTLIICSMTALVIIVTGVWDQHNESSIALNKAAVVRAEDIPTEGRIYDRVQEALAAEGPFEFEVEDGVPNGVGFIAYDGFVGDPRIVYNGDVYSGRIQAPLSTNTDISLLRLEGKMLLNSSALTAEAFRVGLSRIGNWGNYIVTLCVFMFAISTMISWSYYGDRCINYLAGYRFVLAYRIVFTLFVFLGAVLALETVWSYGDLMLGIMVVPNLLGVLLLSPDLVRTTRKYFDELRSSS
ncbi:MAG: alanine/glycine:cation symporter family protein [Myxococcota bacterium]